MEINDKIIKHVEIFIDKTRHLSGVKFRFTLGRYSKHFGFEPHIFQKEKYEEIKLFLESCVSWENITENITENEINNEINNENLILCTNGSYDLMVSNDLNVDISGIRTATSFKFKHHVFVLSSIKNNLNEIYYTFEIIAYVPINYTSKYIGDSSLLKIQDILKKLNTDLDLQFKIVK